MSLRKFVLTTLGILIFFRRVDLKIYHFKLDVGSRISLCPELNYTCGDGERHFLCRDMPRINPECVCHKRIPMPVPKINAIVRSTNGLRSKIATRFDISNMNLLYWSRDLSEMAERYLLECRAEPDECLLIGTKKMRVSQNYASSLGVLTDRWPGRIVRSWYMELGANTHGWNNLKKKLYSGTAQQLSNMIYPLAEFMGCSGALIRGKYIVVCYYYPAFNISTIETDFIVGSGTCTKCDPRRELCSKSFYPLCGVDYELIDPSKAVNIYLNIFIFVLFLFGLFIFL